MSATFQVVGHPTSHLLDVRLGGLFGEADMAALSEALIEAVRALPCAPGEHRAIYDITACKIQPQAVVARLRALSGRSGRVARRLAIVVGPSLMRMQLKRIVGEERIVGTFDDRASALAWLARPA